MTTAVQTTSPYRETMSDDMRTVADWLAANGIDELLPDQPTFEVYDDERILYRAFKFNNDNRSHNVADITMGYANLLVEDRIVPVVTPLTAEVREAFERSETAEEENARAFLLEVRNRTVLSDKFEAYRKRLGLN